MENPGRGIDCHHPGVFDIDEFIRNVVSQKMEN